MEYSGPLFEELPLNSKIDRFNIAEISQVSSPGDWNAFEKAVRDIIFGLNAS